MSETDELSLNDHSPGNTSSLGPGSDTHLNIPSPTANSSTSSTTKRVRVAISEDSSSVSIHSSSSSSYAKRYLPSRNDRRNTNISVTTNATCSNCSVRSAPIYQPYTEQRMSPNSSAMADQYASHRRWTFFEIGKTPRGAPRGLVVPYMYMRRNALTVRYFMLLYCFVLYLIAKITNNLYVQ